MAREIKFRAWDEQLNTMIHADADVLFYPARNRQRILMQFSGLLDKNGTSIYEGDIIKYSNSIESGEGRIEFNCGFNIWWDLKTVVTNEPSIVSPLFYFQCSAEIEILGNIYENPELLNR